MTINEINNYIKDVRTGAAVTVTCGSGEEAISITFHPLDFGTVTAIADNIADLTVSDAGRYRPELKELLLLYHVLNEASDIEEFKAGEFDQGEMFCLLNSGLGLKIMEELPAQALWMLRLMRLTDDKINYRRSLQCNPAYLVNQKMSALIDKELQTQTALLGSLEQLKEINASFTPEQLKEYMGKIGDFADMLKNPELNDTFYEDALPGEV